MKEKRIQFDSYEKEIIKYLKKHRPTIYTILRHVSQSGMSRRIDVYFIRKNKPVYLTWLCQKFDIGKIGHEPGLVVGGCGMDMGFHVVYSLSHSLFPKGFKLQKGQYGRNGDKSSFDRDGGYALRQEWL